MYLLELLTFFSFTATATPAIYTLSLHDALPICEPLKPSSPDPDLDPLKLEEREPLKLSERPPHPPPPTASVARDRKSTRLNSSHVEISYAVFCLKKKKERRQLRRDRSGLQQVSR